MNSFIVVKTNFQGKHFWKNAPDEVSFLKIPHDHNFFVEVELSVKHNDRECEFFLVKRSVDNFIKTCEWSYKCTESSCEMMATDILNFLKHTYKKRSFCVRVLEDNTNGAVIYG